MFPSNTLLYREKFFSKKLSFEESAELVMVISYRSIMQFSMILLAILWSIYCLKIIPCVDSGSDLWMEAANSASSWPAVVGNATPAESNSPAGPLLWWLWLKILRPIAYTSLAIMVWCILNIWRLVREKRRVSGT